jgi:hypothetical protein
VPLASQLSEGEGFTGLHAWIADHLSGDLRVRSSNLLGAPAKINESQRLATNDLKTDLEVMAHWQPVGNQVKQSRGVFSPFNHP